MSFDYAEVAAEVDGILVGYGAAATLSRVTPGAYDTATGTTGAATTETWDATGAKFDYESRDIDGTLIRRGDQRCYLSTVGIVNPRTGDTLTIGGTEYQVIASRPLQPALTAVLYDVQLRGVL